MKKVVAILSILSAVLLSQLSAVDNLQIVAKDDFFDNGNCPNELICKGWSSGNANTIDTASTAGSYSLRIARNEIATKTFFFPTLKAGQNVTVKFVLGKSSNNTATNAYTLTTKLNNGNHTYGFSSLSGAVGTGASSAQYFREITYTANLDMNKKLQIDFVVNGASGTGYGYVNSVTIIAEGVVWIDDAQMEQNFDSDKYMHFVVHNPSALPAFIEYETVSINAQEGVDYEAAVGILEFESGDTSKNISVKILQHSALLEADRRFAVSIASDDVHIIDIEAIGTIKAHKGTISIEDAGFIYAGNSSSNSTATFMLKNSYTIPVSVNYQTLDISAESGINYVAQSGTVTFAANEKTKHIVVPVIGNDTLTAQKEFKVVLTGVHLTRKSAIAVLYGDNNSQKSTGTNLCSAPEMISFLNNSAVPVSGVIKGSMTTTGYARADSSLYRKGRFYEFTAGMDARVEITIKALGRTLEFIQATRVGPCTTEFTQFSEDTASNTHYVLKGNQEFDFATNTLLPANSLISWWMNPEGEIKNNDLDPRKVEHSVMHVKKGEKGYLYVGASNTANTQVTTNYEIEIKYLPEVTVIRGLSNNGISNYNAVNPLPTRNLYGNIKLIGNSFLCITDYGDGTGGFRDLINAGLLTKPSGDVCTKKPTETANYQQMPYLDMDSDPSTYNSVMARLSTPAGSKVVWAGLFWTGMVDRNSPKWFKRHQAPYRSYTDKNTYEDNSFGVEKILLKIPGSGSYQDVYAQELIYVNGDGAAMFGAYKDITSVINAQSADGEYWVANFRGSAGLNEIGNYGGWSMVIIYEEDPENPDIEGIFRNLSVFNGFGRVDSNNKIFLDGFLTPKNGNVDAFLHIFAGEGEGASGTSHTGDYITLTPSKMGSSGNNNKVKDSSKYPADFIATHPSTLTETEKRSLIGKQLSHQGSSSNNNIFTGTIGKADRYPITLNGNGIDLKSIDIGEHMNNAQSSLTISLNAGGDYFYPSMVATSVQLYDPDICYEENVTYNGMPIQAGNLPPKNGIVEYLLTLKHKEHEAAEKVTVHKTFIEDYGLEYVPESMQVKNSFDYPSVFSAKTDALGDDTAQYSNETIRLNIGRGASATQGGMLQTVGNVSDMVEIKYKAKLITNETIKENVYIIDYSNAELGLDFKNRPIKKCYDFSVTYDPGQPPVGAYRMVNQEVSKSAGSDISTNASHSDNALYTQVAGQPFNAKLIFANIANKVDDPTLGGADNKSVNINLIEYPNYLAGDSIEVKNLKCESAAVLQDYGVRNVTGAVTEINDIVVDNAYRNVTFQIHAIEDDVTMCSPDLFAVRPAYFLLNNGGKLIGGSTNEVNLTAMSIDNNITNNYDQRANVLSLGNTKLVLPGTCAPADIDSDVNSTNFDILNYAFTGGVAAITAQYDNVGIIEARFADNEWTSKDRNGIIKTDCYENNASNSHVNGKVGCDTAVNGTDIEFIPSYFNADVTISGPGGGNFAYLSNDKNMMAEVATVLEVRLGNDNIATNYHQGCYAKDTDYTFSLVNDNPEDWNGRAGDNAAERIMFFEDNVASLIGNNLARDGLGEFRIEQAQFINGKIANVVFGFNFGRSITQAEQPFRFETDLDFDIANNGISNVDTSVTIATIANNHLNFFYGRAFIDDQEGGSPIPASAIYELFCQGCNGAMRLTYGIELSDMSQRNPAWYTNKLHDGIDYGKVFRYDPVGNTNVVAAFVPLNGFDAITLRNIPNNTPYTDIIHAFPDPWLIYDQFNDLADHIDFTVTFTGNPGGWAGKGQVRVDDRRGGVIETIPDNKEKSKVSW
ncbi:MAG: hypothetical protein LBL65_04170 [Campylobacteraceae bacterium]|jgi:cold shock CspA family protein|nr:hypothetical protein [Campylobacteraceae bacterium]